MFAWTTDIVKRGDTGKLYVSSEILPKLISPTGLCTARVLCLHTTVNYKREANAAAAGLDILGKIAFSVLYKSMAP